MKSKATSESAIKNKKKISTENAEEANVDSPSKTTEEETTVGQKVR